MSHMVNIDGIDIVSLSALRKACERVGATLDMNNKKARFYSGTTDVDGVISHDGEWDIGVIKKDGKYELKADFWGQEGRKNKELSEKLRQYYPVEATKEIARKKGYGISESVTEDGSIKLSLTVY